jgi:hypothetical protein
MFRIGQSAFDLGDEIARQLSETNQQDVAISQPYAIVVMVWMAYLPKNPTVPVSFQRRTAFPGFVAYETGRILGRLAVIEVGASFGEIAIVAWRIRHLPSMDNLTVEVD